MQQQAAQLVVAVGEAVGLDHRRASPTHALGREAPAVDAGRDVLDDDAAPAAVGGAVAAGIAQASARAERRMPSGGSVSVSECGVAVRRHRRGLDAAEVAHAAAAVDARVAVEQLAPVPAARHADAVVVARHRREVADDQQRRGARRRACAGTRARCARRRWQSIHSKPSASKSSSCSAGSRA